MESVREDIMFLDEVIGAGEIAISDERGMDPSPRDLARLAHDCFVGGHLSGKAGLVHFHVGEEDTRLQPLRDLLEQFNVRPQWLYPTHVERTEKLFGEAVALAKKGMQIDVDVMEQDLPKWVCRYREQGGPPQCLTASSDASLGSPRALYEQVVACITRHGMKPEDVLPLVTSNTARILKLPHKGRIEAGMMGDLMLAGRGSWDVVHVFSRGVPMVRDGELVKQESFLEKSNRVIRLTGTKDQNDDGNGG
jgi:beta-aspartyl-dipeptidase (metallo-type)